MTRFIIILSLVLSASISQAQDLCDLKGNIPNNLSYINHNIKALILSPDNCVLDYMDTLLQSYLTTKDTRYLDAIMAIDNVSDGYVSEYLWEIYGELMEKGLQGFTGYLYQAGQQGRHIPPHYMLEMAVQSVHMNQYGENSHWTTVTKEEKIKFLNQLDIPEEVKAFLLERLGW